jgi:quinoprotein glucose dehydrogenase
VRIVTWLAVLTLAAVLSACEPARVSEPTAGGPVAGWPHYGNDSGGTRYSPLTQITKANVRNLTVAWTYRTGDIPRKQQLAAFEATPILVGRTLYLSTPFNRVIALDAETGAERWTYDPKIDLSVRYSDFTSRGVAAWADPQRHAPDPCAVRIFHATNDARLFALDAASGALCADFGGAGQVDLSRGVGKVHPWEYGVSSAPVVLNDLIIVGSKVADNQRIDAPSGVVRAYDARTGTLRWAWDPLPPGVATRPAPPADGEPGFQLGTANAWAPLSVDPQRNLVFVPTGNTAPDYWAAARHGSDFYSSSVVALDGTTGKVVWHFQTVHHDVWDYDVPAQPVLVTVHRDGTDIPAVAQATKMGEVFLLRRETGTSIFPVEERPVPQTTVPGEETAPTQPVPVAPPPVAQQGLSADDAWGVTPLDRAWCRRRIAAMRSEGIFTPPSLEGTVVMPGNAGGTNWGSAAFDPGRHLLLVNSSNLPFAVRLVPRDRFEQEKAAHPRVEFAPQLGTPYGLERYALLSPLGIPCSAPPWGTLAAIDVDAGTIRWQVSLGTLRDILPIPLPLRWGTPNLGGPIVTASGVVFIGAAMDNYLRAFDSDTGAELWKGRLPAGGQATPMTYRLTETGRQYVVIAAGGHGRGGTTLGDSVVAFALP